MEEGVHENHSAEQKSRLAKPCAAPGGLVPQAPSQREACFSVGRQRGLQNCPGILNKAHPSPVYPLPLTPRPEIWGKAAWSHSSKEDKPGSDSIPWCSSRESSSMTSPPFPSKAKLKHDLPSNPAGKIRHDVSQPPPHSSLPTQLANDSFSPRGRKKASQKWLCLEVWVSGWPLLPLSPRQARLPRRQPGVSEESHEPWLSTWQQTGIRSGLNIQ